MKKWMNGWISEYILYSFPGKCMMFEWLGLCGLLWDLACSEREFPSCPGSLLVDQWLSSPGSHPPICDAMWLLGNVCELAWVTAVNCKWPYVMMSKSCRQLSIRPYGMVSRLLSDEKEDERENPALKPIPISLRSDFYDKQGALGDVHGRIFCFF